MTVYSGLVSTMTVLSDDHQPPDKSSAPALGEEQRCEHQNHESCCAGYYVGADDMRGRTSHVFVTCVHTRMCRRKRSVTGWHSKQSAGRGRRSPVRRLKCCHGLGRLHELPAGTVHYNCVPLDAPMSTLTTVCSNPPYASDS